MRKLLLSTLAIVGMQLSVVAQVSTHYFEDKTSRNMYPQLSYHEDTKSLDTKVLHFDSKSILSEKEEYAINKPFRFGHGFDVSYTLNDGKWEIKGSNRVWKMRVQSKGAYSLNFIFKEMKLSDEAELYIYNPDGSMVYGPVTSQQNTTDGVFLTDLIMGEEAIIELIEPSNLRVLSTFEISKVVHAYVNTFSFATEDQLRASENCNVNVACETSWTTESNAIA